ncbi:MAG: GNAT family N-acetyltransferase [Acutalibacteraceae bacterium]|nr:GNAT family N-acetyltransferase [Acutalibacteraceae bacterium]
MFETKRLIIRPYITKDANVLLETIGKYEIYKTTYGIPYPCDTKYAKRWIQNVINNALDNRAYEYAIIQKSDKRYLGNVGLINIDFANQRCDISYFINPGYWGNGIATEASAQLIEYAFNVLNMNRVGGSCMEHNIASSRVMEKLLMSYEGTIKGYFIKDNEYVNIKIYSIMRDEFFKYFSIGR